MLQPPNRIFTCSFDDFRKHWRVGCSLSRTGEVQVIVAGWDSCFLHRQREIRMWAVSWCSSSTGDARSLEVHREILRFTRSSSLLPPTLPPTTITNCHCRVLQTFSYFAVPLVFTVISTAPAVGRCCPTFLQQRQETLFVRRQTIVSTS